MNLNSIVADRSSAPQTSPAPNGGSESFQLAYAKVFDERYAPGAVPERTPQAPQNTARPASAAHTVHMGETLTAIARARLATLGAAAGAGALRESITQLAKANNIRNPDRIYAGQKLDLTVIDAAFGRNQSIAVRVPQAIALRDTVSPAAASGRFATDSDLSPHAQWHAEDKIAEDAVQMAAGQPAPMPTATLPLPPAALAAIDNPVPASMPPIDPMAARQVALYELNASAAAEKSAEPARALPDIIYKGIAGKVLDAMPIEPSTRANLQRANTIVSSTVTARSLGVLTGLGGPLLTVAGLIWGIFSSRQIEAAPAGDAKPVADSNPVVDAKKTAQTRVADALN